jgi:hypothetical protein
MPRLQQWHRCAPPPPPFGCRSTVVASLQQVLPRLSLNTSCLPQAAHCVRLLACMSQMWESDMPAMVVPQVSSCH